MLTHIDLVLNTFTPRKEILHGREHIVVPAVLLTEGVFNGLYYPAEELAKFPAAWNGRPVPIMHPTHEGVPISCNDPETIQKQSTGWVFNTKFENGKGRAKLKGEIWVDVAKCDRLSPQTLATLRKGGQLEISTGLFLDEDGVPGTWNNKEYRATVRNYRPDHLALLPEGKGACCWDDGCGVRANKHDGKEVQVDGLQPLNFMTDQKQYPKVMAALDGYDVVEVHDEFVICNAGPEQRGFFLWVNHEHEGDEVRLGKPRLVERTISYTVPMDFPSTNEEVDEETHTNESERDWAADRALRARVVFETLHAKHDQKSHGRGGGGGGGGGSSVGSITKKIQTTGYVKRGELRKLINEGIAEITAGGLDKRYAEGKFIGGKRFQVQFED